jgi:Flp pilus assembly pilin Flp
MRKLFLRLWKEEIAQDLVEYALILLLIVLAAVTSIRTLSNGVKNAYSTTSSDIRAGGNGGGDGGHNGHNNNNNNNNDNNDD